MAATLLGLIFSASRQVTFAKLNAEFIATNDRLKLDAVTSEEHSWSAEVTENPIEDGGFVSDHVDLKPDEVTITGVQSDSPISLFDAATRQIAGQSHIAQAITFFRSLFETRTPVKLITTYRTYNSMICTSIKLTKSTQARQTMPVSATFREIRIVQTELVDVGAIAVGLGAATQKLGDESPTAAKSPEQPQSILSRLTGLGE